MAKTWNQNFSFLSFLTHYTSEHSVSDGVGWGGICFQVCRLFKTDLATWMDSQL